jgi:hypothetical protein
LQEYETCSVGDTEMRNLGWNHPENLTNSLVSCLMWEFPSRSPERCWEHWYMFVVGCRSWRVLGRTGWRDWDEWNEFWLGPLFLPQVCCMFFRHCAEEWYYFPLFWWTWIMRAQICVLMKNLCHPLPPRREWSALCRRRHAGFRVYRRSHDRLWDFLCWDVEPNAKRAIHVVRKCASHVSCLQCCYLSWRGIKRDLEERSRGCFEL